MTPHIHQLFYSQHLRVCLTRTKQEAKAAFFESRVEVVGRHPMQLLKLNRSRKLAKIVQIRRLDYYAQLTNIILFYQDFFYN